MDLVDSQVDELIEMAREASKTCGSIDTLAAKHDMALKKLVAGCFLGDTKSCKKISNSIREIFTCIHKTCSLVERSLDEHQRSAVTEDHYESLVKVFFQSALADT
jgi:hypothetical protein